MISLPEFSSNIYPNWPLIVAFSKFSVRRSAHGKHLMRFQRELNAVFTFLRGSVGGSYITILVLVPVSHHATNFYFLTWTLTVIEWIPEENWTGFHWHANSAPWTWVACELRRLPSISTTTDSIGAGEKARNLKEKVLISLHVFALFSFFPFDIYCTLKVGSIFKFCFSLFLFPLCRL